MANANPERPLSPHLQVYKPQLTSILSITHRATGAFLAMAAIGIVAWLWAVAAGGEAYQCAQTILSSWFGKLVLSGTAFALWYHLCNGIRHLFWDAGYGFELKTAYRSGYLVIAASVVLTIVTIACAMVNASH